MHREATYAKRFLGPLVLELLVPTAAKSLGAKTLRGGAPMKSASTQRAGRTGCCQWVSSCSGPLRFVRRLNTWCVFTYPLACFSGWDILLPNQHSRFSSHPINIHASFIFHPALQSAARDTPVRPPLIVGSRMGDKDALHSLVSHRFSLLARRDIKPQNVLLISTAADSTIKLADFGSRSAAPPTSVVVWLWCVLGCGPLTFVRSRRV